MSQTSKMILLAFVVALLTGSVVYLWQHNKSSVSPSSNDYGQIIKYNCEKSGGSFSDSKCECPLEKGQTQEIMYDKSTGYCQSTNGGPAGDAFNASVGLPYGDFAFWSEIVGNNCTKTGGEWLNAHCTCSVKMVYDKSTGDCKTE